jgi:quinol-cytochrome oxidoreductase complex cytochrome b subunit
MNKANLKKAIGLPLLDYTVPTHANTFWYSLGGITLICFVVSFVTGAILTQFYNPGPTLAHASVNYISSTPWLRLIRALHHWSANLGFILLIGHMLRVMFTGAFRPPRTITYLVGLLLLFVVFQLFFTGTVLKWDQEGYEAMAHFVAVNKLLGPLGAVFQEDFTLSTSMLARIYALHIGIFPALLLVLIVVHFVYVKLFGIAPKPFQSQDAYQESLAKGAKFTQHLKFLLLYGSILLLVLLLLAIIFPPGLLEKPKPGIEVTKPPWVFWIFYPIESAIGIPGILLGTAILSIGLILIPILGLIINEEKILFRTVRIVVIVGLIMWFVLLIMTYFSPVMQHM